MWTQIHVLNAFSNIKKLFSVKSIFHITNHHLFLKLMTAGNIIKKKGRILCYVNGWQSNLDILLFNSYNVLSFQWSILQFCGWFFGCNCGIWKLLGPILHTCGDTNKVLVDLQIYNFLLQTCLTCIALNELLALHCAGRSHCIAHVARIALDCTNVTHITLHCIALHCIWSRAVICKSIAV